MKTLPAVLLSASLLGVSTSAWSADPKVIPSDQLKKMWRSRTPNLTPATGSRAPAPASTPAPAAPAPTEKIRISRPAQNSATALPYRIPGSSGSGSPPQVFTPKKKITTPATPGGKPVTPYVHIPGSSGSTSSKTQEYRIGDPGSTSGGVKRVRIPGSSSSSSPSTTSAGRHIPGSTPIPTHPPATKIRIDDDPPYEPDPEPIGRPVRVDADSGASFQNIQFQLGSTEFTGSSTFAQLAEIADAMRSVESERFLIEGHTCDLGSEDENFMLSTRRAMAVRDALVGLGVPRGRLQIMGFGEDDPAVPNYNESARSQNRRVQIFRRLD